jgi:hypothetical protein
MPLDAEGARRFYGRLGRLQDTQAFYEDAATARLVKLGCFAQARSPFERFRRDACSALQPGNQLSPESEPPSAQAWGFDARHLACEGRAAARARPLTALAGVDQEFMTGPEQETAVVREVVDEHLPPRHSDQCSCTGVFGQPFRSARGSAAG